MPSQRRNDGWRYAVIVKWNFVLVLTFVAVNQTSRYFGKQFWVVKHGLPLFADINIGGGLSKRIPEKCHAAKTVLRHAML